MGNYVRRVVCCLSHRRACAGSTDAETHLEPLPGEQPVLLHPRGVHLCFALDCRADPPNRFIDWHTIELGAVPEAETHGASSAILLTRDELNRGLFLSVVANLLLHPVVTVVD